MKVFEYFEPVLGNWIEGTGQRVRRLDGVTSLQYIGRIQADDEKHAIALLKTSRKSRAPIIQP